MAGKRDLQSFELHFWMLLWLLYDKDSKDRFLGVQALEVMITFDDTSGLTLTGAQPNHTNYGM